MPELDDLPKMVSLSPEPITTLDDINIFKKNSSRNESRPRRHNLNAEVIEVLWRQDCDLGLTRHDFDPVRSASVEEQYDAAVLKKVARLEEDWTTDASELQTSAAGDGSSLAENLWSGLDYTIDSETGEYVLRLPPAAAAASPPVVPSSVENLNSVVSGLDEPLLTGPIPTTIDDLISSETGPHTAKAQERPGHLTQSHPSGDSGRGSTADSDSERIEIQLINDMVDAAQDSAAAAQPRHPLGRMVSMEQRWQDLASILLLPGQMATGQAPTGPPPHLATQTADCPPQPAPQTADCPPQPAPQTADCPPQPAPPTAGCPPQPAPQTAVCPPQPAPQTADCPPQPAPQTADCPLRLTALLPPPPQAGLAAQRPDTLAVVSAPEAVCVAAMSAPASDLLQHGFLGDAGLGLAQCTPTTCSPDTTDEEGLPPGGERLYYQLSPAVTPTAAVVADEGSPSLDSDTAFLSRLLGVDESDLAEASVALAPLGLSTNQSPGSGQSPPAQQTKPMRTDVHELGSFRSCSSPSELDAGARARLNRPPAAQKKYHMFGKRIFNGHDAGQYGQPSPASTTSVSPAPVSPCSAASPPQRYGDEAGVRPACRPPLARSPVGSAVAVECAEVEYSAGGQLSRAVKHEPLTPTAHNHTYQQLPQAEAAGGPRRPVARDKGQRAAERLSRDERRARDMNIPMSAEDIVYLSMDEFNERLGKLHLTESQLSLVRDVRRRGKNKLAAQNCRKRKLDQILTLTDELKKVRNQRQHHLAEHEFLTGEHARIREKYAQLHRHVFQSLRDERGAPYSPAEYSLQLSADGVVLLVPRSATRGAAFVPPDLPGGGRRN